jgi:hypothetical protein
VQNISDSLKTLKNRPVIGPLLRFADARPRLAAWIFLSLGIVILLIIEARDVGLLITQWIALIVASVLVAGLCIWIVTWEDGDEAEANVVTAGDTASAKTPAVNAEEAKSSPVGK